MLKTFCRASENTNGAYDIARPAKVRTSKAKGLARQYRGQYDPEITARAIA